MGKAELNKLHKLNMLLDSAFDLFTTQGVEKTSISEISEKAGVAKGTFYLYFHDKHELKNRLIYHKSSHLFKEAVNALNEEMTKGSELTFEDKICFVCDFIINELSENKMLLAFISKNLSWGLFKKALTTNLPADDVIFKEVYYNMLAEEDFKFEEPEIMMFMIIELVGSTCFSSILYNEPADINRIKPYLFKTIRAIINEHRI